MEHIGYCPNCKKQTKQDNLHSGSKSGENFKCRDCGRVLFTDHDGRVQGSNKSCRDV
jgi:hypothetical protein